MSAFMQVFGPWGVVCAVAAIGSFLVVIGQLCWRRGNDAAREEITEWLDDHRREIVEKYDAYQRWLRAEVKRDIRARRLADRLAEGGTMVPPKGVER